MVVSCLRKFSILAAWVVVFLWPLHALAACSNPSGSEGQYIYNADYHVMQYCNGTRWRAMGANPGTTPDVTTNRAGYWKFDDGSGATATDSSGNGNNGTLINTPSWITNGKISGALSLNGTNQSVQVADAASLRMATSFTIAAWVKPDAVPGSGGRAYIIDKEAAVGTNYELDLENGYFGTGGPGFVFNFNSTGCCDDHNARYVMAVNTGTWYHVAGVYDSTAATQTLYVNGTAVATNSVAGLPPQSGSGNLLYFGEQLGGNYLTGTIDEIKIYSRALSASEILALYNYSGVAAGGGCSNPAGTEGQMLYNQASHVMQYCDGTVWRPTGPSPGLGGAGCTSPAGAEGNMIYSTNAHVMQYCDGTNWYPTGRCQHGLNAFTDATNIFPGAVATSNVVQVPLSYYCGINTTVSIAGSGSPQFQICSDSACSSVVTSWGSASQTITPGQYVQVRLTSSSSVNTTLSATLTAGTQSTTWNATTRGPMRIFATSTITQGLIGGGTGGISAGDTICNNLASTAGLSGTYMAWLAITSGTDDPNTRMTTHANFAYVDTTGTTIANNWTGLISGTLVNAIGRNESGGPVAANQKVWTNVTANTGTTATVSGSQNTNCNGWTNNGGGVHTAPNGVTGSATATWTNSSTLGCNGNARLYCVEQ